MWVSGVGRDGRFVEVDEGMGLAIPVFGEVLRRLFDRLGGEGGGRVEFDQVLQRAVEVMHAQGARLTGPGQGGAVRGRLNGAFAKLREHQ